MDIVIERLVPRFLLGDKNGYAMAKAIETGMKIFAERLREAQDTILNIDKMPEWRLDELAWEYGTLYDYSAEIDVKREWIRNAISMAAILGTPGGIYQYLRGYFDNVKIIEGIEPYTFRLETVGDYSPELEAWALRAAEQAKNVRSVMDGLYMYQSISGQEEIGSGINAHITEMVSARIE